MTGEGVAGTFAHCMAQAVELASAHVRQGGVPFAALVVDAGGTIVGRGVNRVRALHDPTAHAEVDAIRDACRHGGRTDLRGHVLFASGEPCAMCYLAALQAGIEEVYFAVDRHGAAACGFDYRAGYALFARDPLAWPAPVARKLAVPLAMVPFHAFLATPRVR